MNKIFPIVAVRLPVLLTKGNILRPIKTLTSTGCSLFLNSSASPKFSVELKNDL